MFRSIFNTIFGGLVGSTSLNSVNILSIFNISNGNLYITDGNGIRSHTAQIYNQSTSTDLNLVTVKSSVHQPLEDVLKMDRKL
jgi:hypothetical protein